jgi:hypothetical protein
MALSARDRRKLVKRTTKVVTNHLGPIPVVTAAKARGGVRPSLTALGIVGGFALVSLVIWAMTGLVVIVGVIPALLIAIGVSPHRVVAVCDRGFVVLNCSMLTNEPQGVEALVDFDRLVPTHPNARYDKVEYPSGHLWMKRAEMQALNTGVAELRRPRAGAEVPGLATNVGY